MKIKNKTIRKLIPSKAEGGICRLRALVFKCLVLRTVLVGKSGGKEEACVLLESLARGTTLLLQISG